jgi:hypothetical protein
MHSSDKIESIERAMPREQTRNQHPKCGFENCKLPATFTLRISTASGSRHEDLCWDHLTKKLENPIFAARVLTRFIAELLPKV